MNKEDEIRKITNLRRESQIKEREDKIDNINNIINNSNNVNKDAKEDTNPNINKDKQ